MLLVAMCLCMISRAAKTNEIVVAVENSFLECEGIVKAVGEFVDVVETTGIRRRADKDDGTLVTEVEKKLGTCGAILEAAGNFRKNYMGAVLGTLALQSEELDYINKLLKVASKKMGGVLYTASEDGDTSTDFHTHCDKQGPTVTIIRTISGTIFGGYTDVSWSTSAGYKQSSKSFIFGIRPFFKKYAIKSSGNAVYHNPSYGPTFGSGHDINVKSGALTSKSSYVAQNNGYHSKSSYEINGGTKNFQVLDYVVLKAVAL